MFADRSRLSKVQVACMAICIVTTILIGISIFIYIISGTGSEETKDRLQQDTVSDHLELVKYPTLDSLVSLVELFCNPEKYHGKKIAVEGVFLYEFEGTAIYLNSESADYRIGANAIWVDLSSLAPGDVPRKEEWKKFDGQYIRIEGYYNKDNMGHLGGFQGTIERISRVYKLERH